MPNLWIPKLPISNDDLTLSKVVHWIAKHVFQRRGYRWEVRRRGELKLGYWRKQLKKRDHKKAYPKRFVLIPGFGDTSLSWYGVLVLLQPILRQNFDEIILFDFPGFGGFLSKDKAFPSLELMMTVVDDTLDSLKPHTIMGHSLGGWLAAHYGALCGSGVRPLDNKLNYKGPETLLLSNPSGIYSDEKTRKEIELVFKTAAQEGFSKLRPHLFAREPIWFRWFTAQLDRFVTREDIIQFLDSIKEEHAVDVIAGKIQSEIWFLWGEKDTLVSPSSADYWLKHLDEARRVNHHVVLLKNVGHSPQIETPSITAAVIGQILSKRSPHPFGKRWWQVLEI